VTNNLYTESKIASVYYRQPGYLSGIGLGCGLDDRGFESLQGLGIFFFTTAPIPALGPTHPPIQLVPGDLSLGVKLLGCETAHSESSAEVNSWSYTFTSQYAFVAWCSVKRKNRDNFTSALNIYYCNILRRA
jgi:hypothetical protein